MLGFAGRRAGLARPTTALPKEARMKRVHYLAGAIGLAPAALGLLTTQAAHAADTTAAAPQHNVKTVSLHHVVRAGATTAAATSSSSSASSSGAVSPGITGTACTGNTAFTIPKVANVKGHGWYANGTFDSWTCIGTVDVHLWFNKTFCKTAILSIKGAKWSAVVCGSAGHGKSHAFPVHHVYNHVPTAGVNVCASSTYAPGPTCRQVGS
jgi:hypothetical protein